MTFSHQSGRQFDKFGGLSQWWPSHVVQAYKDRLKCYQDQYSNMIDTGKGGSNMNVNGNRTLGENIAVNDAIIS